MMLAVPWWAWVIVAAILSLAELHVPGSYFIWIALGALLTAAMEGVWGLSLSAEIGTFALASGCCCVGGYFIYRRLNRPSDGDPLNRRNLRMIGESGVVSQELVNGHGKVRLGDSVWLAEGPNLTEGTPVIVKSVRGTLVIVGPADTRA